MEIKNTLHTLCSLILIYTVQAITDEVCFNSFVNLFPNKPWFLRVCSTSLFENIVRKGEITRKSNQNYNYPMFLVFQLLLHNSSSNYPIILLNETQIKQGLVTEYIPPPVV